MAEEVEIPQLPEHHGVVPVGVVTSVNGSSSRLHRPMEVDEKVVLIVEGEVSEEGHRMTGKGLHRVQKIKAVDVFELDGAKGQRLLNESRKAAAALEDARAGRVGLPDITEQVDGQDKDDDEPGDDKLREILGDAEKPKGRGRK